MPMPSATFAHALANEPNDVESLYFLALSQLQQNRADDALQTIASGIALEPEALRTGMP